MVGLKDYLQNCCSWQPQGKSAKVHGLELLEKAPLIQGLLMQKALILKLLNLAHADHCDSSTWCCQNILTGPALNAGWATETGACQLLGS